MSSPSFRPSSPSSFPFSVPGGAHLDGSLSNLPTQPTHESLPSSPSNQALSSQQLESHRTQFNRLTGGENPHAVTSPRLFAPGEPGAKAEEALRGTMLSRGLTAPPETEEQLKESLRRMEKGERTVFPFYTGFRFYDPKKPLKSPEINTFIGLKDAMAQLRKQGFDVELCFMLADLHAEHNTLPRDPIPKEEGGQGIEGYGPYYKKVAEEIATLGEQAKQEGMENLVWSRDLSDVYKNIPYKNEERSVTPHDIEELGKSKLHFPGDPGEPREGQIVVTEEEVKGDRKQAVNMIDRTKNTKGHQDILSLPEHEKEEAEIEKGKNYRRYRNGESELIDRNLEKAFNANVIPMHAADPEGCKRMGMFGYFVKTVSYNGQPVDKTSWALPEKVSGVPGVVVNQSKLPAGQLAMLRAFQNGAREQGMSDSDVRWTNDLVRLSDKGASRVVSKFDELEKQAQQKGTPITKPRTLSATQMQLMQAIGKVLDENGKPVESEEGKNTVARMARRTDRQLLDAVATQKAEQAEAQAKRDEKSQYASMRFQRKMDVEKFYPRLTEGEVKKEVTKRVNTLDALREAHPDWSKQKLESEMMWQHDAYHVRETHPEWSEQEQRAEGERRKNLSRDERVAITDWEHDVFNVRRDNPNLSEQEQRDETKNRRQKLDNR